MAEKSSSYVFDVGSSKTAWGFSELEKPVQIINSLWNYDGEKKDWSDRPTELLAKSENVCPHFFLPTLYNGSFLQDYSLSYEQINDGNSNGSSGDIDLITSLDPLEQFFKYVNGFYEGYDSLNKSKVIMTEPSRRKLNTTKAMMEFMFEGLNIDSYFPLRKAPAIAFAMARSTAAILECGPRMTTITPVFEAYSLSHFSTTSPVCGDLVDYLLAIYTGLYNNNTKTFTDFTPYICSRFQTYHEAVDKVHPKFTHLAKCEIINSITKQVFNFATISNNEKNIDSECDSPYELPDGQIVNIKKNSISQIATYFMAPQQLNVSNIFELLKSSVGSESQQINSWEGLPNNIFRSIFKCDSEAINTIASNILCNGGLVSSKGFLDRLSYELNRVQTIKAQTQSSTGYSNADNLLYTGSLHLRVSALPAGEQQLASYFGACAVGHVSSFDPYWFTSVDYNELGSTLVDRKVLF